MQPLFYSIGFGVLGGLIRALVGILKYLKTSKQITSFKLWYLISTLVISGIVGGFAGALVENNWKIASLAGYAGVDFLEGLYKIKFAKLVI